MTVAKQSAAKKTVSTQKASRKASRKASAKKTTARKKTTPPIKHATATAKAKAAVQAPAKKVEAKSAGGHVDGNPYRTGSYYAICFDCLSKTGSKNPVSRKELLANYCKASGKDEKRAKYDLAVILSPSKEGGGHRSSRKMAYWVERLADGAVRLHMAA